MARTATSCVCESPPTGGSAPKHTVTLVHGTRARHAPWMQDGHPLPDALSATDGTRVHRFCWSGVNRQTDRLAAGEALRVHLVGLVGQNPEADHHVVAHSHGGNVALYALRDAQAGLDPTLRSVQVTTLATPFLSMRARPLSRFVVVFVALSWVLMLIWGIQIEFRVRRLGFGGLVGVSEVWYVVFIVSAFCFGLLLPAALLGSAMLYRRGEASAGRWRVLRGKTVDDEAAVVTPPSVGDERLFVIRARGDEASGVLGAAYLASWIWARMINFFPFGFVAILIAVVVLGLAGLGLVEATEALGWAEDPPYAGPIESFWDWSQTAALVAGVASGMVVSLLLAFTNLPFGVDTLFWNLHAHITAEPSPVGSVRVLQVSNPAGSGWAHRVYDNEEAIQAVVERVAGTPPCPSVRESD